MSNQTSNNSDDVATINYGWLKFVYGCTIFLGLTTGPLMLFVPKLARKVIGVPNILAEQEPLIFTMLGSFWIAGGIIGIMGLRWPLKFLPLLMAQVIYKSIWLLCVFLPMLVAGTFPTYGWALAIGNSLFLAMDLKAIPFGYLFSDEPPHLAPANGPGE